MDIYDAIKKRRTIRDFENTSIPDDVIERIVAAGMSAPTNDHMRDWHFVVISDRSVVLKLISLIPKSFSEDELNAILRDWSLTDSCQQAAYLNAIPKQHRMLAEAGVVIVPLFKQKVDLLHPDNLSHLNGFASIWCCIENMLLAATAEGLGATLRIPLGNEGERSREVLGYPNDYLAPCFLAFGVPKPDAPTVAQREYSLDEKIHKNAW